MILVMLAPIGGCCAGRDVNGRGERGGENDRDRSYERVGDHDIRNTILREPPL
jgi:hypothetical protein